MLCLSLLDLFVCLFVCYVNVPSYLGNALITALARASFSFSVYGCNPRFVICALLLLLLLNFIISRLRISKTKSKLKRRMNERTNERSTKHKYIIRTEKIEDKAK